jgi:flavin reductase (DIM6/NTAB) family NADH-FMN oxidoreductase RutF
MDGVLLGVGALLVHTIGWRARCGQRAAAGERRTSGLCAGIFPPSFSRQTKELAVHRIDPTEVVVRPFHLLDREWALLVAGREKPNPMTVSWGGMGTLWGRSVVTIYVRPTRYTWTLLEAHSEFTLNFLPEARRASLQLCGSRSGRDGDKWAPAGLEPVASERIAVPRVAGARLAFECRVLASLDFDPSRFLDPSIQEMYAAEDYHRIYVGEVAAVWEE